MAPPQRRAPGWRLPLRRLAVILAGIVLGTALALAATAGVRYLLHRTPPSPRTNAAPPAREEAVAAWTTAGRSSPAAASEPRRVS